MNATASARRRPEAEPQPVGETPDAEFFRRHPDRLPNPARDAQRDQGGPGDERRLLVPCESCVVLALVRRIDVLRRQRVVVEGWGMGDLTRWGEDAIAKLFADVTAFGWLEVEGRAG